MSWGVATQNGVSVSLASIVSLSCGATEFSPASLFTSGVAGAWYDPSDVLLNWRTNLLTYSQEFDNAAWTKAQTTVSANAVTAPDGTTTADKMVETAVTNVHGAYQTFTYVSGATYSASVYAKQAERSWIYLGADTSAAESVFFDLANGTVGAQGTGYVGSIQSVGDGWYRCTVTITQSTALPPNYFVVGVTTANNTTSYLGDITKGVYIWGAQLELGSTATTYQAITTPEQTYLLYDPQPVLYQDSAGTTPVTAVEQPVGLMLDKSQGLVLGNNQFVSWLRESTSETGSTFPASCTSIAASGVCGIYVLPLTSSRTYRVDISWSGLTAGRTLIVGGGAWTQNVSTAASGSATLYVNATSSTNFYAYFLSSAIGQTVTISSLTVRELPGNHALQATSASRPILRARYNLLTYSEQFDNAAWSKTQATVSANAVTAPDGTNTADKLVETTAPTTVHYAYQTPTLAAATHTLRVYLKAAERSWAMINVFRGTTYSAFVNLSTGAVGNSAGGVSVTATSLANSWWQFDMTFTVATAGSSDMGVRTATANGVEVYTGDGTSGIYIWGADLRTGSSAGTYQRIAAATDYATAGFLPYLALSTDDSFGTNSIDFTATDKMSVCAGLTKLSDTLAGIVAELSANWNSNAGSFLFAAPSGNSPTNDIAFGSRGTAVAAQAQKTSVPAPVTAVATGLADISGDIMTLRYNGSLAQTVTSDQGTGNYGNYPLYIGRRANASVPFEGRIYQFIVCGKTLSASELSSTEAYVATKTGVVI